jgi:protein TonB
MLNRLLESKAKHEPPLSGAIASVAAHTALIGLAIYATARAHVEPTPGVARPLYQVLARFATPSSEPGPGIAAIVPRSSPVLVNPAVRITLPSMDLPVPAVGLADFRRDPVGAPASFGAANTAPEGAYATFRADQVEKQVSLMSASTLPRYPEALRMAGVGGQVVAQFVVDEEGRVEERTVRFRQSDNPLFEESVRTALGRMRFTPAEIAGKKVRQLVEMPFVFALSR